MPGEKTTEVSLANKEEMIDLETGYLHQICYLSNDSPCENGRR